MPDQLGEYQILEEIGHGTWGTVYRARSVRLHRVVALRVLDPALLRDPFFLRHLHAETPSIVGLEHDHVVRVYGVDEAQGWQFIVMEYIAGGTLTGLLRPLHPLPLPAACTVVRQAAAALDHLHSQGLAHHGVRPGNVFLQTIPEQGGRVKLGDPGPARAALKGSVHSQGRALSSMARYISPEQARGEAADIRSNVYSLGVVAYEMLTGRTPFGDGNLLCCIRSHAQEPPPPPARFNQEVSRDVQDVILQALAKDPARRFPSAGDLARELDAAAQRPFRPAPVEGPTPAQPEDGDLYRDRQPTYVLGFGVGLAVLLVCLVSAVAGAWMGTSGLLTFWSAAASVQVAQTTPLPRLALPETPVSSSPQPATAAPQAATAPAVTLHPANGPSGTQVLVRGRAFAPGDVGLLTWDGHVITPTQPARVVVDLSGQFQAAFYAPTDSPGGHTVSVGTAHGTAADVFVITTGEIQPTGTPQGSRNGPRPASVAWRERR